MSEQKAADPEATERKEACDYLFLVGGFANSVLLQERIKKAFAAKVIKIIIPPDPGSAVLTGAVAYGLDPSRIRTRRARLTYGCRIMAPFEEGVDPEPKERWDAVKNGLLCRDRFKYLRAGRGRGRRQSRSTAHLSADAGRSEGVHGGVLCIAEEGAALHR